MKEKLIDKTTIKFLAVGVVNTLVGTGVMFLLYNVAKVPYWPSVCANYICGGIVSYFLNKHFTFQNKERSWQQVVKFILTVAVCMFIGYGVAKPVALWALSGVDKTSRRTWPWWWAWGCMWCSTTSASGFSPSRRRTEPTARTVSCMRSGSPYAGCS